MKSLRTFLFAALALLPSLTFAQPTGVLPGLPAIPRGFGVCQFSGTNGLPTALVVPQAAYPQCNSAGQLFSATTQGGTVLSATNGMFTNVLQGNAVLSATNGLYSNLLQGNAVLSTSNPIFITGTGTAGSAASNPVTVQGIASMTPILVNPGTIATWGLATIAAGSAPTNQQVIGGRAQNAEPTAATNGQTLAVALDLTGKQIVSPYANKENLVEGAASVTGTSSTSLISAPGSGLYIYVTDLACFNSGSTGVTVSIQNGSGGTTIWQGYVAASGGAFTKSFNTPIGGVTNMTVNTALFFQAGGSTSTLYCNANGFKGT